MNETLNIPRDTTLKQLVKAHQAQIEASGTAVAIDSYYNGLARQINTKAAMDALFVEWWHKNYVEGTTTRLSLLERWFGSVLVDDRIHGVKMPLFATSNAAIAELTDDSAGLTCTPSTSTTQGKDDFAGLPQFWCVEVSWEKTAAGSVEVYAVEFIDDIDVVRSGESHMCGVAQKNTFIRDWNDSNYHYLRMKCFPSVGYKQWDDGKTIDGTTHTFMIHPKYYAGINSTGTITCGTGLAPYNTSLTGGISKWRGRGTMYAGARGSLLYWQLAMVRLKYATKGNSGVIEGCSSYYNHYTTPVSETGVTRVIVTTAQGANLMVGGSVNVGAGEYSSSQISQAKIKSLEAVTISGTNYTAVNLDTSTTFDTVAGTTQISTMPFWSGWNDTVQGNDGSRYSFTNGHEPGLIQKTEFQNGSYLILSDELWQWGKDASGNFTFDIYTCASQANATTDGTISSNYVKMSGATMVFPSTQGNAWLYIEDMLPAQGGRTLWPAKVSTSAGSGTGVKAGFYCYPASSGVRAPWCVFDLSYGGICGLPGRYSYISVGDARWYGSVGCPSMAG